MVTCEYCHSHNAPELTNCKNCGAPLPARGSVNNSHLCPSCGHRLLALASPRCNICGQQLPEEFIRAREAELKRINDLNTPLNTDSLLGQQISKADGSGVKKLLVDIGELLSN
jgi:DNA-directed RNA polymerase subunit RPC12/RpoP